MSKRPNHLDNLVDECVDAILNKGVSIASCLESYPDYAEHLEPLLTTALAFRELKAVKAPLEYRRGSMARLTAKIEQSKRAPRLPEYARQRQTFFQRLMFANLATAMMTALFFFLGTGTIGLAVFINSSIGQGVLADGGGNLQSNGGEDYAIQEFVPDATLILEDEPFQTDEIESTTGAYCTNEDEHPRGLVLAERYAVPYEEVIGWYCAGRDFEEIVEAYDIHAEYDVPVATLFDLRDEGLDWETIRDMDFSQVESNSNE